MFVADCSLCCFFFFKQKTAYDMRISDWSSDVCSSDLLLFEWKPRSFVPVVVAVLVAWAWRPLMIGTGPMFGFDTVVPGGAWPVVAASAIGLVVGIEAALLSAALYRIAGLFHLLPLARRRVGSGI